MKPNFLILAALAFCSISLAFADLKALPRFDENGSSKNDIPLSQVSTPQALQHSNAYLFEDTETYREMLQERSNWNDSSLLETLGNSALLFDRVIFPKFIALFPTSVFKTTIPKITLIFDDMDPTSVHRGYVSRRYPAEKGVYVMILDSKLAGQPGFAVEAAHELQHIFNYYFSVQNGSTQFQEDWLNEGLSGFMELYISGVTPDAALAAYATTGKTTPTWNWPTTQVSENDYAGAFLWIAYLYYHFGRDELLWRLISDPRIGMDSVLGNLQEMNGKSFNVPEQFLTPESLLGNYALSLSINSRFVGEDGLFAVTGDSFVQGLHSLAMQPEFALLQAENSKLEASAEVQPKQARYLRLSDPDQCLSLDAPDGVFAYLVESVGTQTSIQPIQAGGAICPALSDPLNRVVVLVNEGEQPQTAALVSAAVTSSNPR